MFVYSPKVPNMMMISDAYCHSPVVAVTTGKVWYQSGYHPPVSLLGTSVVMTASSAIFKSYFLTRNSFIQRCKCSTE